MSFTNGIMDSSPIALPVIVAKPNLDDVAGRVRGLKRSASVASLPTPPRPRRGDKRRLRTRSPELCDDEEIEVEELFAGGKMGKLDFGVKKTKDKDGAGVKSKDSDGVDVASPSSHTDARSTGPLTPPRSRRQTETVRRAFEDPLENPFLETPVGMVRELPAEPVRDDEPNPVDEQGEKQYVCFVFKGKRLKFPNPLYGRPPSSRESLPIAHPDYSPPRALRPRNLFPKSKYGREAASRKESKKSGSDSEDPFSTPTSTKRSKVSR